MPPLGSRACWRPVDQGADMAVARALDRARRRRCGGAVHRLVRGVRVPITRATGVRRARHAGLLMWLAAGGSRASRGTRVCRLVDRRGRVDVAWMLRRTGCRPSGCAADRLVCGVRVPITHVTELRRTTGLLVWPDAERGTPCRSIGRSLIPMNCLLMGPCIGAMPMGVRSGGLVMRRGSCPGVMIEVALGPMRRSVRRS